MHNLQRKENRNEKSKCTTCNEKRTATKKANAQLATKREPQRKKQMHNLQRKRNCNERSKYAACNEKAYGCKLRPQGNRNEKGVAMKKRSVGLAQQRASPTLFSSSRLQPASAF
jgi:hypothetical protein